MSSTTRPHATQSGASETAELLDWLLREIADAPCPLAGESAAFSSPPEAEALSYALGVMASAMELAPMAVYARLCADAAAPAQLGVLRQARDARLQGRFPAYDVLLDGVREPFHFRISPRPLQDETGRVWAVAATVALAAPESDQRLRITVEAGKVGIWEWDIASDRLHIGTGMQPCSATRWTSCRKHSRPALNSYILKTMPPSKMRSPRISTA